MMRTSRTTDRTATITSRAVVNSTARAGCIRCIIARGEAVSVIRAATFRRRSLNEGGTLKRRVVIRRILSILALTVSVTAIAAIGLSADVFAGFQRRATDALFPAAPDDLRSQSSDSTRRRSTPRASATRGQRNKVAQPRGQLEVGRRTRHRVRRHLPQPLDDARARHRVRDRSTAPATWSSRGSPRSARWPMACTPARR